MIALALVEMILVAQELVAKSAPAVLVTVGFEDVAIVAVSPEGALAPTRTADAPNKYIIAKTRTRIEPYSNFV